MSSATIETLVKLVESLPEDTQDRVVEHLRDYLEDLQSEREWDRLFKETQPQLAEAARRARREIAQGLAKPLDPDDL